MSLDPKKYILVKKSGEHAYSEIDPREYFVLRMGDAVATSTLWSYIHNLRTLLELDIQGIAILPPDVDREYLQNLADDVSKMASEWEAQSKKIPD